MQPAVFVTSALGAAAILAWRMRETTRPVTAKSILIPPLGMATGFSMFVYPPARIPPWWALLAFLIGAACLAYPMIKTSKLVREGDTIFLRRSRAFIGIVLALVALRFGLREYVGRYLSVVQTGSIMFVLAFGMIVRWRAVMYFEYKKLRADPTITEPVTL
jgi:membrane protein CcdC involved in cytochrome C biogenesis